MRVFFDTNVWVSAMIARGVCLDLMQNLLQKLDDPSYALLMSSQVRLETLRILSVKLRVSPAQMLLVEELWAFSILEECPSVKAAPADFPDADDWPILCAALNAQADWFVTGDKALLALGQIEAMPIIEPRTAYLRLRGLA